MHQNKNQNKQIHIPVLLAETLQYLSPKPGEHYLDLTAGYGGHARAVLTSTKNAPAVLVDRDQNAVDYLREKFDPSSISLRHQDFLTATRELVESKQSFDLILADLGVSSPHLNTPGRGFAIVSDGPLDMRMDQRQTLTAATIANSWSQADLVELFRSYGEEPKAAVIARQIVANRPFSRTKQLADVVARVYSSTKSKNGAHKRAHPATKVFQAMRIAVNDELGQLSGALPLWIDELLRPGGRLAVISFHSLEDRLVKQSFVERGGDTYDATIRLLTKHPVTATQEELVFNPRSRSAKLRAAAKINTKK